MIKLKLKKLKLKKLNIFFYIYVFANISCSQNFVLNYKTLHKPFKEYKKQATNNSDFIKYAKIEFDSCKNINLSEDIKSSSNEIDKIKRQLINKLLSSTTISKNDLIFIQAKMLQAQVDINYAKRYSEVDITIGNLEQKLATKIKREIYAVNYVEKAVSTLSEAIKDTLDNEMVCLLIHTTLENALIYVKIGMYFVDAPIPRADRCTMAEYRYLILKKYKECLIKGIYIIDSFEKKHGNLKCLGNNSYNELINRKQNYKIKADSVENLIEKAITLRCKE